MQENVNAHYVTRVLDAMQQIPAAAWDDLLERQSAPTPFMRHAYLQALQSSDSACPGTGWTLQVHTLWSDGGRTLAAACPLYVKSHSRGEYVFDWAWAEAYERHGLAYYPKAVVAVPFTPVPGSRLLACSEAARDALLQSLLASCRAQALSSLHILFADPVDLAACARAGLMQRAQPQFHWHNSGWHDFEAFLDSLRQDKRKKIRQERRKVRDAGVVFRSVTAAQASPGDWAFMQACYQQTYWEHGNAPYLQPGFFEQMQQAMPDHWLLFIGELGQEPVAMSLIGLQLGPQGSAEVAYGRYWGASKRLDSLHFEACYYQPIEWCIQHGVRRFEGGAQGEHKMARALLPAHTASAHWLAHPAFAEAVSNFLQREGAGIQAYMEELGRHSPMRQV